MKEIATISLERLNNGAHYLFILNVLSRAKADTKIMEKPQATPLVTALDPQMQLDKGTGLLTNFTSDLQTKYTEQFYN